MDRNSIIAFVLCGILFLLWNQLYLAPEQERLRAEMAARDAEAAKNAPVEAPKLEDLELELDEALATSPGRVPVETPYLTGSINLKGARIDDLLMKEVKVTQEEDSDIVRLFRPANMADAHYIQTGWFTGTKTSENAVWTAAEDAKLTPETPVTLMRVENGVTYERVISVDDNYMFTVTQTATNNSGETLKFTPYGRAIQRGLPEDLRKMFILHEGPIAVVSNKLHYVKYDKLLKKNGQKKFIKESGTQGWLGLTSKDRLAAIIPMQDQPFTADLRYRGSADKPVFDATMIQDGVDVAPGGSTSNTLHLYAGEKIVEYLKNYEKPVDQGGLGIQKFDEATDWGALYLLTRPIFFLLNMFAEWTGNYGVAILLLVLVIKAILFPLANKSFKSMARMKKLSPEITALRDRYKEDPMELNKRTMELYKKEKINPLAGCWPMLLQMPVFIALYKVLFVTNEMRHESFLYISDLSERDPTNMFNLFGLLPFDPMMIPIIGTFLGIGLLPLLNGLAMFVQTKLNPPPTDPVQAQVMTLMPIIFTFIFAPFAAGLVLYWFWNAFLGVIQQWVIMKRQGVEVDLFGNMAASFKKKKATAAETSANDNADKS